VPTNPPLRLHDSAASVRAPAASTGEGQTGRLIRQTGPDGLFARLSVSKATGHRLIAAGKVGPRPIRLGGSLRYHLGEVMAWLEHRRPDGQLHDARTWPAVWQALQKGGGR
jgi:predicted DNA-binding transcriptional regulator AlpA